MGRQTLKGKKVGLVEQQRLITQKMDQDSHSKGAGKGMSGNRKGPAENPLVSLRTERPGDFMRAQEDVERKRKEEEWKKHLEEKKKHAEAKRKEEEE